MQRGVDVMLLVTCPSLTGWHWLWVGREAEHLGPCVASTVRAGSVPGVLQALHACTEDSLRLLDPIIHWPAKLPEVDATWCIPAVLLCLGWCLLGGGQVSSRCWGRATLLPPAGWWFGEVGAGSYYVLRAGKS